MTDQERLDRFEKMMEAVQKNAAATEEKMEKLKAEGKAKSVTFRQLLGIK